MSFSHQKFTAYRLALSFVENVQPVIRRASAQNRDLADQLKRASTSIVLNIAEGAGRSAGPDRRRFYLIARGSANECAASVELCCVIGVISRQDCAEQLNVLNRICAILTTVCFPKNPQPSCGASRNR